MKLAYSPNYLATHTMKYSRKGRKRMDPEQLDIIIGMHSF